MHRGEVAIYDADQAALASIIDDKQPADNIHANAEGPAQPPVCPCTRTPLCITTCVRARESSVSVRNLETRAYNKEMMHLNNAQVHAPETHMLATEQELDMVEKSHTNGQTDRQAGRQRVVHKHTHHRRRQQLTQVDCRRLS